MGTADSVIKRIKSKKVMRASELAPELATRAQLRRMAETGDIIGLGSGFYAHSSMDPFIASIIATARYYPKAVISNITALVIHGLSDERIDRIDVDIPRKTSIRNKLIHAHCVSNQNIVGTVRLAYHGQKIRIYSKERAICDAYRIDPEGPIFLKAILRYVRMGAVDPDLIAKYDKVLSTNALRSIRQELADE